MTTDLRTWDLWDFGGGLDLRNGSFSDDQTTQRIRRNVYTTRGPNPATVRRWPCLDVGGQTSAASQSLLIYQGRFYVFCKKGDVVTHTGGVLSLVTNLEFDPPEYTTTWEVLASGVHEGFPYAYILHQGSAGAQIFLHVWDGLLYEPTYVMDPAFPGSYTNGPDDLAGQVYEPEFRGVVGSAVSKVWASNVAGNVQCCRTADTRIWNQRDQDSFLNDGEHYVFRVPGGVGATRDFHVPRPATDLPLDQRWAYYVLEKAVGEAWEPLTEVETTPTVNDTWQAVQVGMWGSSDVIRVRVLWGSASAGLIRLRLVAGATQVQFIGTAPTVTYSGVGATRTVTVSPYEFTYRGGDKVTASGNSFVISQGNNYLVGVGPAGVSVFNVTNPADFPTGFEREALRLIEHIMWPLSEAEPNYTAIAGTVAITAGQPTITGTGTAFTQKFRVGDYVLINGERKKISLVTSDTVATAESNFASTVAGQTLRVWDDPAYRYAYENAAESEWFTAITLDYIDRAGAEDAVTIATRNHDKNGGRPTAIGHHLNRLVVFYPGSIQSWEVDQSTNATRFLAVLGFGTDEQEHPCPVLFHESVAVSLGNTVRGVYVSGANTDSLKDNNIGEKIEGLPMPQTRAACHWVNQGQLVVAGTDANGDVQFLVFDYSSESKVSSWSVWDVTDLPEIDVDTLFAVQSKLYFRAGNRIRYFDAKATVFRDADEVEGSAYLSRLLTPLHLFNKPGMNKQTQFIDIHASGNTHIQFELASPEEYDDEDTAPKLDNLVQIGSTFGAPRMPAVMTAVAIAVDLSSQDERGWKVRGFGLSYQLKKR